jgi:hypothetical protein
VAPEGVPRKIGTDKPAGLRFVAQHVERFRRGRDQRQPRFGTTAREARALAQKAITGVHERAAVLLRDIHDLCFIEVRARAATPKNHGMIGVPQVRARSVILGRNGHRSQSQSSGSARDAHGDFATVGDQQAFVRHPAP